MGLYIPFEDWANALECWRSPSLRMVIPGIAVSPGVTHSTPTQPTGSIHSDSLCHGCCRWTPVNHRHYIWTIVYIMFVFIATTDQGYISDPRWSSTYSPKPTTASCNTTDLPTYTCAFGKFNILFNNTCHGATMPQCHAATVPRFHGTPCPVPRATVPRCHGAIVCRHRLAHSSNYNRFDCRTFNTECISLSGVTRNSGAPIQ